MPIAFDQSPVAPNDPFLREKYDALHDSPMQQKFRKFAPMPYGVVFLPWKGMTEEDMRHHYRMMRELGFTNLKQTMGCPGWPRQRILEVALEEGIIPFWYGEAGYADITPAFLKELGLPEDMPVQEALKHPKVVEHNKKILHERIHYEKIDIEANEGGALEYAGYKKFTGKLQLHNDPELRADALPHFKAWCKERYGEIQKLTDAWNHGEVGITNKIWQSWEEFDASDDDTILDFNGGREYGFVKDVLRFKADMFLDRIRRGAEANRARDPEEPQRAGGEMGLFLPFAWRGTDMEGIAELMREHGSFYPSLHFAWHFEEVEYEVARTVYMQSSLTTDWFKGGWNATWESTGGPQQFSGAKGWTLKANDEVPGFDVGVGAETILQLSYLAGGYRGVGIWSWNYRKAGWEGGEYALLNRNLEPGLRAQRVGAIAKAANRYREELWAARKEPLAGVFVNWDCEAIWAAISVRGRDKFKNYPIWARIGASRAMINGNVPWEHVMASDIRNGLAHRYRSIYLPAQISIGEDMLDLLRQYVEEGGRIVLDAPGAWFDEKGCTLMSPVGSAFEKLFGAKLNDFQYSNNRPRELHGHRLDGWIMELEPTQAKVRTTFDNTGEPAVIEHQLGKGSAIILAFEASLACFQQGANPWMEAEIRKWVVGPYELPYRCENAIVFRQAAPSADHYFFINDDREKKVTLDTCRFAYKSASDPVTGESLEVDGTIDLEAYSGRWIRYQK